uniref:Uncharacterized protein n=1 Tax=Anguilla anguilla TaxID=7936 RepID=A0A0E9TRV0_ANGAN
MIVLQLMKQVLILN